MFSPSLHPTTKGETMRKLGVPVAAVLALGTLVACQGGGAAAGLSASDRAAVQKSIVDDAVAALAAKDFTAFANTYTSDAAYLPPNGPGLKGRDAMISFLSSFPPYSDFNAAAITIDGAGNVAYVQGTYSMMVTPPGASAPVKDEGKWVVTAKRQADGSWKATIGIFNSDLPIAPVPAPAK